jgi:hypothetical protein
VGKLLIAKKVTLALMLAAAHGSAGFDAWSTRRHMRFPGAREQNPLMRPFARSLGAYVATQGDVIVPELLMRKLPKKWKWVGYAWIAGAAGAHLSFGVQNLHWPPGDGRGSPLPQWESVPRDGPNAFGKANAAPFRVAPGTADRHDDATPKRPS